MTLRTVTLFIATAITLSFCGTTLRAQTIPNAGFENWTGGNPDGWQTANAPGYTTIQQVSDAHGGSSAVKGTVIAIGPVTLGGQLLSGANGSGFACTSMPAAVHGWYKFNQGGNDSMLFLATVANQGGSGVGAGAFRAKTTQSTYKEFVANMYYSSGAVPATMVIGVTLPQATSSNTFFQIDDLSFGAASAVDESGSVIPAGFQLEQNYPNPFNPSTGIIYDIPTHSHVTLVVRDMIGRVVATLVDETTAPGRYKAVFDASGLGSGTYVYTLTTDSFSQSRVMTLLK